MGEYTIGVDVGGTNIKLGLVHASGRVTARSHLATAAFSSHRNRLIGALAAEIELLRSQAGLNRRKLNGVGIGLPGPIDFRRGIVRFLPNIPGWNNVPLKTILETKLKVPVFLDNDVKLITLAEWKFGAGKGISNLVCLTLGTGVGSGLIINNQLYRGAGNTAGELGHISLNEQGPPCNCGGYGCLEAYIGNRRLVARAQEVMKRKSVTLEQMNTLARQKDPAALAFWEETAVHLGNALVTVVNLINPERIVIGGGVSNNHQFLFKTAAQVISRRAMPSPAKIVRLVRARLGDEAGILGARVLVANALVD